MARQFKKLTRPRMRTLNAGEQITEAGITFQRLMDGDGCFSVNVMVDQRRVHRVIGRESEGVTRTTAESFIANLRASSRVERLNLPHGRKVTLTIAAAVPRYLERLSQEGGLDLKRKKQRFEQAIMPFLGTRPLSQLSTSDIERYKKYRLSQPVCTRQSATAGAQARLNKPATVNRELAALSHLISKAVEWGWTSRPAARIHRLKEGNGRITYLTAAQVARLLDAAKADQNFQIYAFIFIGVRTGMRKSEILATQREHVDVEARTIYVPHAKAGPRTQPITAELAAFLDTYIETLPPGTPWLFPSVEARSGHTIDVRKAFVRCVKRAGLDPKQVVRHTLRHTAITHLVQAGVDLPTVKRISGHKTMAMVERYAHQSGAHIAAAMDKLDQRFRAAGRHG